MLDEAKIQMQKPKIINVGLESFYNDVSNFTDAVNLSWKPPASGDPDLSKIVANFSDDNTEGSIGKKVASANVEALRRINSARPVLFDIQPAGQVIPGMTKNTILHSGPPITWERMCGAAKGSVIGALMYEGLASNPEEAAKVAAKDIVYAPCHEYNAVGPMTGIISSSMPVWMVRNETYGNTAYCTMNEGWGRTLRFGAYDEKVLDRLKWMESVLAPAMKHVIKEFGGIDLKSMIAQALQMGDECHNRDIAATNLFFKMAVPVIVDSDLSNKTKVEVVNFLGGHEHFFLNLAMAACKASLVPLEGIPYSTVVTALARNGVEVGITISSMPGKWFTVQATVPQGLYFPGYSEEDANPDIGDSAVTETAGIGAFAMGSAPAIVQFVGGTAEEALQYTREMYEITVGKNPSYKLPALSFMGTPTAIDIRKVVEKGIQPVINTGIAHKEPGHGLVGAGIVRAPQGAFEDALRAFAKNYHLEAIL